MSDKEFVLRRYEFANIERHVSDEDGAVSYLCVSAWFEGETLGTGKTEDDAFADAREKISELEDEMECDAMGTTGPIVDLFNDNLTQEEWNALAVIHRMRSRLNIQVIYRWSKSIDVVSTTYSQIVDESVFLNKEEKNG